MGVSIYKVCLFLGGGVSFFPGPPLKRCLSLCFFFKDVAQKEVLTLKKTDPFVQRVNEPQSNPGR